MFINLIIKSYISIILVCISFTSSAVDIPVLYSSTHYTHWTGISLSSMNAVLILRADFHDKPPPNLKSLAQERLISCSCHSPLEGWGQGSALGCLLGTQPRQPNSIQLLYLCYALGP